MNSDLTTFLPMSRQEMDARGWDSLDVLLITGDAYVDHPAFGAAVIGRVLEAAGYRVGVVAQPDWTHNEDFAVMGAPRLFVGVTSGAMDSMVANYTANKKIRRDDAYSPGGVAGKRPNNATIVYANIARHLFKNTPVILGGIEASLRRFAYYDYWKDSIRRSILLDSKADLIVAGMGEKPVLEIAQRLKEGRLLHGIPGTVESLAASDLPQDPQIERLPSLSEIMESKKVFLEATQALESAVAMEERLPIAQQQGDRFVVEWPPEKMTSAELDHVFALPFQRRAHFSYKEEIPALKPVEFSIVSHRGCFGGCSFCALSLHQGKQIVSRSEESILREIRSLTHHPAFKGTISDVGGPSANMYSVAGHDRAKCHRCRRVSCLFPAVCPNLNLSHAAQVRLLQKALSIPGVKHLFIASGVRYDMLIDADTEDARPDAKEYLALLIERLVGGHLSVAPEHMSRRVLRRMRKPSFQVFTAFARHFARLSASAGKEQYLIPYFIASFPGSTENDMEELADYLKMEGRKPQQIQDFLPCPMTLAAAMYYAELDESGQPIFVARNQSQRQKQRELLLGQNPAHDQRAIPHARPRLLSRKKTR